MDRNDLLQESLPIDLDVSAYAETVVRSDSSSSLEGVGLAQVQSSLSTSLAQHIASSEKHPTTVDSVGTYAENTVRQGLDEKLPVSSVPLSRFGTMNYLSPAVMGGIQALSAVHSSGTVGVLEPDGTVSFLVEATNGETTDYYYGYLPHARDAVVGTYDVSGLVVTNDIFRLRNHSDYTPRHLVNSTAGVFLAWAYRDEGLQLFLCLAETLAPAQVQDLKVTIASTALPTTHTDKAISVQAATRVIAWIQTVNGVKTVKLAYNIINSNNGGVQIHLFSAPYPTLDQTDIHFERETGWTQTKIGNVVETGVNALEPYNIASSADPQHTPRIRLGPHAISAARNTPTAAPYIMVDPNDPNRVVLNHVVYFRLSATNGHAVTIHAMESYLIDFAAKTFVDVLANEDITFGVKEPSASVYYAQELFMWPEGRQERATGVARLASQSNGNSMLYLDSKYALALTAAQQQINSYVTRIYAEDLSDLFDLFTNPTGPRLLGNHADLTLGKGSPIFAQIRCFYPINERFCAVYSYGTAEDGSYISAKENMPLIARHNDGDKSLAIRHRYEERTIQGPMPLSPRIKHIHTQLVHMLSQTTYRLKGPNTLVTGGSILHSPSLTPFREIRVNEQTAALDVTVGKLVISQASVDLIRPILLAQAQALYPDTDSVIVEVFVPAVDAVRGRGMKAIAFTHVRSKVNKRIYMMFHNLEHTITDTPITQNTVVTVTGVGTLIHSALLQLGTREAFEADIGYSTTNGRIGGTSFLHEFDEGYALHLYGCVGYQLTGTTTNGRYFLAWTKATQEWTHVHSETSHSVGTSLCYTTTPDDGIGMYYNDNMSEAEGGTKALYRPIAKNWNEYINFNASRYSLGDAHYLFTIKPPVSYDITIPNDMPVMVNGEQMILEAQTFNLHTVCETHTLTSGRYYMYLKCGIDGELAIVTNPTYTDDTSVRTLIGHADFDGLGITDLRLIKVTKVGPHRLTGVSYIGQEERSIVSGVGHPSSASTSVTYNVTEP